LAKGDVWQVDITETVGVEQYGTRPAIILAELTLHRIAIIVPVTKNMHMMSVPFTTVVQPDKSNGLVVPSVALVPQIRAVDMGRRLLKKLGVLSPIDLATIEAQVRSMLQL
jgi:mRNA-degrading endonuclease toxin of MazEF toxin-antitoxin module